MRHFVSECTLNNKHSLNQSHMQIYIISVSLLPDCIPGLQEKLALELWYVNNQKS